MVTWAPGHSASPISLGISRTDKKSLTQCSSVCLIQVSRPAKCGVFHSYVRVRIIPTPSIQNY